MNERTAREGLTTAELAGAGRPDDRDERMEYQDPDGRAAGPDASWAGAADAGTSGDGAMAGESAAPAPRETPLFVPDAAEGFRARWVDVQAGFVDEPRGAVQQADSLVAEVMKGLAEMFAAERTNLESQWSRGDDVSTEDLRVALQRYRSFFDRLLSI